MILFDRILDFTQTAIPARALMVYRTRTKIRFANGSEIVALPCGRDGSTLRGFTADMVILDECNFIPRDSSLEKNASLQIDLPVEDGIEKRFSVYLSAVKIS